MNDADLNTLSNSLKCEDAFDDQIEAQYYNLGSTNPQKHLNEIIVEG